MSELAMLGLQGASGAFVRPTAGKPKADKKETKEQRRKRERRELIAATRTQAAGSGNQASDPGINAGIRLNRRERHQAAKAKQGSAGGRSVPSRRSPDRGRGSAGGHSPSSQDRGRGRGREGQHGRARRSP